MDMHPPTDEELGTLPQDTFTSDKEWDPSIIDNDMDLDNWMVTLNGNGRTTVVGSIEPLLPLLVNQLVSTRKLDFTDDVPVTVASNTDLYSSQKVDTAPLGDDDPSNAVNDKPIPTGFPDQHDRPCK